MFGTPAETAVFLYSTSTQLQTTMEIVEKAMPIAGTTIFLFLSDAIMHVPEFVPEHFSPVWFRRLLEQVTFFCNF